MAAASAPRLGGLETLAAAARSGLGRLAAAGRPHLGRLADLADLADLAELVGHGACAGCDRPLAGAVGPACDACRETLRRPQPRCRHCSVPLAPDAGAEEDGEQGEQGDEGDEGDEGEPRLACPRHELRAPGLTVQAPWAHEGPARRMVHALKYRRRRELASELARALLDDPLARAALESAEVLVPAPAHPLRRRERGFDQALLLASELSAALPSSPRVVRAVRRSVGAGAQAGLSAAARRRAIGGATRAAPGAARRLRGRRVAVIDDVVTSGATVRAVARWARRSGASEVTAIACTRARRPLGGGGSA